MREATYFVDVEDFNGTTLLCIELLAIRWMLRQKLLQRFIQILGIETSGVHDYSKDLRLLLLSAGHGLLRLRLQQFVLVVEVILVVTFETSILSVGALLAQAVPVL